MDNTTSGGFDLSHHMQAANNISYEKNMSMIPLHHQSSSGSINNPIVSNSAGNPTVFASGKKSRNMQLSQTPISMKQQYKPPQHHNMLLSPSGTGNMYSR